MTPPPWPRWVGSATVSGFGGDVVSVTGTGIGAFCQQECPGSPSRSRSAAIRSPATKRATTRSCNPRASRPTSRPASLTVTGLSGVSRVYNATDIAALSGTASLSGVLALDVVTPLNTASGTFDSKNVGTAKPITTAITLDGADALNYVLTQPSGLSADVTKANLAVTGVTASQPHVRQHRGRHTGRHGCSHGMRGPRFGQRQRHWRRHIYRPARRASPSP
jgi:hypothetical protein